MRNGERVMWFLIGAAVGAGVALLYAPQSGKDTRKYIRRKTEDARDALADTSESAINAGRAAYRKSVEIASGAAESAADLLSRAKAQVRG